MPDQKYDRVPTLGKAVPGELITSDGAVLHYRVQGSGPPLILLPGWSQSGAMFGHQLSGLSARYRVIVLDIRGHGESPEPKGGLRMSRLATDLSELLTELQLERPHVLGWSMGASVLWSYIDLFGTGALDRLIFVDQPSMLTVWPGMSAEEIADCGALFTSRQIEELYMGLRSDKGEEIRAGFVGGMVTKTISPELLQWIRDENAKTSLAVASQLLWSHCSQDWRDVLDRVDRPTLVISGAVSHVDKQSQYYVHSRIKNSQIRVFSADEGGAHFMFLEAPHVFNAVVENFLNT